MFYDGECGLCDRFVQWLVRHDRRRVLRYATLQGETARNVVGEPQAPSDVWSVKLLDEQGLHDRSTAALRTIAAIGGVWKSALVLLAVPRPIRDGVYKWVAANRYRWFGRHPDCLLLTPALRERFLP